MRLDGYLDRYPMKLSGGQQQARGFGAGLAYSPATLLFDEASSNLDASSSEEMRIELRDIHRRIGVTAIYVTHDQAEAMVPSDRIVVMGKAASSRSGQAAELYEGRRTPCRALRRAHQLLRRGC